MVAGSYFISSATSAARIAPITAPITAHISCLGQRWPSRKSTMTRV
jgi:hypothetical protein